MMETEQLMGALRELTNLFTPMWFWKMDTMFNVIHSDCPHESLFRSLFLKDGRREALTAHMAASSKPVCYTVSSMLSWVMAFGLDGDKINTIYIMGPFFVGYNDPAAYPDYLAPMKLSKEAETAIAGALKALSVISVSSIPQIAIALHYCIRREKLPASEVAYYVSKPKQQRLRKKVEANQFEKSSGRWAMEQELLDKVRQGDLSAANVLSDAGPSHMIQAFGSAKNVQAARLNIHQLLTLISRAAVDGGLPQRTSFSLCSEYRNRLEQCATAGELAQVSNEMVRDYASRVHNMKQFAKCSPSIRLCCEYIDTHPGDKLTLEDLAEKAGYSSFHLSRKFRKEMGISIIDYIQRSKLERAKYLLVNTDLSMDDISAELGFNSRTYFTEVFKKHTGETPTQYRRENATV